MRKVYMGLWALSGVSMTALVSVGYPIVGVGAFVLLGLSAMLLFRRYDGPLFDERDERRQEAASRKTLSVMEVVSAVVFPGTAVLWSLNLVKWPTWLTPVGLFIAGLTFVHVGGMMYEARKEL